MDAIYKGLRELIEEFRNHKYPGSAIGYCPFDGECYHCCDLFPGWRDAFFCSHEDIWGEWETPLCPCLSLGSVAVREITDILLFGK